jgi:hypothetical protein
MPLSSKPVPFAGAVELARPDAHIEAVFEEVAS